MSALSFLLEYQDAVRFNSGAREVSAPVVWLAGNWQEKLDRPLVIVSLDKQSGYPGLFTLRPSGFTGGTGDSLTVYVNPDSATPVRLYADLVDWDNLNGSLLFAAVWLGLVLACTAGLAWLRRRRESPPPDASLRPSPAPLNSAS